MKLLLTLGAGTLLLLTPAALSAPQAQMVLSPPAARTFTATLHYVYHSREYQPAVSIIYADRRPAKIATPEAALMSQLSALRKGDYDWWMGTWDAESREKLERQQKQSGTTREQWLSSVRQAGADNCRLTTWILRRQYVILRYACSASLENPDIRAKDYAVSFKADGGEFVATLDIEKDPVFRYANGTNVELEMKPRD